MLHRRFLTCLLAILAIAVAIQVAAGPAQAKGRSCFNRYYATCYGPAQAAEAERAMAVRPVDPAPAVTRSTRLPLVQVVVERLVPVHVPARIIFYSFGVAIPIDKPMPATKRPALFVTEFVLPKVAPTQSVKSQPGTIPSVLATFAHRKLALLLGGHFPLKLLRQIAVAILHA
ncbi:MAG TPA: hypothetical protein VF221_18005 [Chloroflexota bacterium]